MDNNFKLLTSVKNTYWYINKLLVNVPRNEIILKTHLDNYMLEIVELTYSYLVNKDSLKIRNSNLKTILVKLSLVDFFVLEIYKRSYIKKKKYTSVGNFILEIRKICYGILKNDK